MVPLIPLDAGAPETLPTWIVGAVISALCSLVALLARYSYATKEKALSAALETANAEAGRAHKRLGELSDLMTKKFDDQVERTHNLERQVDKILTENSVRGEYRDKEITRETFIDSIEHQNRMIEAIASVTRAQLPPARRVDERREPSEAPPPIPSQRRLPQPPRR